MERDYKWLDTRVIDDNVKGQAVDWDKIKLRIKYAVDSERYVIDLVARHGFFVDDIDQRSISDLVLYSERRTSNNLRKIVIDNITLAEVDCVKIYRKYMFKHYNMRFHQFENGSVSTHWVDKIKHKD